MNDWETIAPNTSRLEVHGGWLYRYKEWDQGIAMIFVPSPIKCEFHNKHMCWVCSECRPAINMTRDEFYAIQDDKK